MAVGIIVVATTVDMIAVVAMAPAILTASQRSLEVQSCYHSQSP